MVQSIRGKRRSYLAYNRHGGINDRKPFELIDIRRRKNYEIKIYSGESESTTYSTFTSLC